MFHFFKRTLAKGKKNKVFFIHMARTKRAARRHIKEASIHQDQKERKERKSKAQRRTKKALPLAELLFKVVPEDDDLVNRLVQTNIRLELTPEARLRLVKPNDQNDAKAESNSVISLRDLDLYPVLKKLIEQVLRMMAQDLVLWPLDSAFTCHKLTGAASIQVYKKRSPIRVWFTAPVVLYGTSSWRAEFKLDSEQYVLCIHSIL